MYNEFYQFKKEPFNVTPDPDFFVMSSSHKEALAAIIYGIERRKGFIAIVGEVGLGKTTVLRSYFQQAKSNALKAVYIFYANVSFGGLLKNIYRELGLTLQTNQISEMIDHLHQFLITQYKLGNNVALIIDEAHNMPTETLKNLQMLSNLETGEEKLIQIVLIGQPELQERLQQKELRQINQRIALRHTISPLSRDESLGYMRYRLERVALSTEPVFTKSALTLISKHSQGIPRIINIVCDNSLIAGYGSNKKPVTRRIVRRVIADLEGKSSWRLFWWGLAFALIVAMLLILLWVPPIRHKIAFQISKLSLATAFNSEPAKCLMENGKIARPLKPDLSRTSNTHPIPRAETRVASTSPQNSANSTPLAVSQTTQQNPEPDKTSAGSDQPTTVREISLQKVSVAATPNKNRKTVDQTNNGSSPPAADLKSGDHNASVSRGAPPADNATLPKTAATPLDPAHEPKEHYSNGPKPSVAARPGIEERAPSTNSAIDASSNNDIMSSAHSPGLLPARVVGKGDNLTRLTQEAYGSVDANLIDWVMKNNPQIKDINRLLIGTRVVFPALPNSISRQSELN